MCNLVTADLKQPRRQPTISHEQNKRSAVKDRDSEVCESYTGSFIRKQHVINKETVEGAQECI